MDSKGENLSSCTLYDKYVTKTIGTYAKSRFTVIKSTLASDENCVFFAEKNHD